MKKYQFTHIQKVKYLGAAFFLLTGLINLIDTIWTGGDYVVRDLIILLVLTSPLLVNRRLYFLGFGFLGSAISIALLFIYVFTQSPELAPLPVAFYLLGCIIFSLALVSF